MSCDFIVIMKKYMSIDSLKIGDLVEHLFDDHPHFIIDIQREEYRQLDLCRFNMISIRNGHVKYNNYAPWTRFRILCTMK